MTFKQVLKKIVDILGYAVMLLLVAMTAFVLISNARGDVPFLGKYSVLFVLTESMEPEIPARSNILVEKVDPATLEVGDVIVFVSEDPSIKGQRNTHRIIEIVGDHEEFVTKGDHNVIKDEYTVPAANVVGKYSRTLHVMTRFSRLLATPTGFVMLIAIILVILMIMYLPDLKKAEKKQEEEIVEARQKYIDELVAKEVARLQAADEEIRKEAERQMAEKAKQESEEIPEKTAEALPEEQNGIENEAETK